MPDQLTILAFGFLLGLKHAFETDHVAAVTTIVSEHKNPLRAALVGTYWGMGHTTTLFIVGLLVLVLHIAIPQNVSLFFEMMVGVALVGLGLFSILRVLKEHTHIHHHDHISHFHQHSHISSSHTHIHKKSFLMGSLHGLAGSGALMLLVLSTIRNTIDAVVYILLFGVGSVGGMTFVSLVLGLPFLLSVKKFPNMQKYLTFIAGTVSVIVGIGLVYKIGISGGLIRELFAG